MRLFDPARLPDPQVMSRRHRALQLVEEAVFESDDVSFDWDPEESRGSWDSFEGDEYVLYAPGDRALVWAFDHESPFSPWAHDPPLDAWPGMFDGMPDDLVALLDSEHDEMRKSITCCFWYVDGAWHAGSPEIPDSAARWRDPDRDPQGAELELGPLFSDDAVARFTDELWEEPELRAAVVALVAAAGRGEPLDAEIVWPFSNEEDSAEDLLARAAALGLPTA